MALMMVDEMYDKKRYISGRVRVIDREKTDDVLEELRHYAFGTFFADNDERFREEDGEKILENVEKDIRRLIAGAYFTSYGINGDELYERSDRAAARFIEKFEAVKGILAEDVKAAFEGDPAASGYKEIIIAYPGMYAVFVHRTAHILYELDVPLLPRVMSEIAHSRTGIDIHPGADIGAGFFIDHGTGIVIGETAKIGRNVRLYQGVTLGAITTKNARGLSGTKRHPTVGDDVTIYANATVLGGNTVIGDSSTIGSGAFITESLAPGTMAV